MSIEKGAFAVPFFYGLDDMKTGGCAPAPHRYTPPIPPCIFTAWSLVSGGRGWPGL